MSIIRILVSLLAIFCMAALIGGYFGALHPALDSLSHFRLHLAAAAALLGALMLTAGRVAGGSALVISGLLVLGATLGASGPAPAQADAHKLDAPVYRLMQINLSFDNKTPKELIRLIGETKPDIITANEVSRMWRPKLEALKHLYPHQTYCAGHSGVGDVAVLSRRPFAANPANFCSGNGGFAIQAVDFGGRAVLVSAMHLHWPWPFIQAEEISTLSPALQSLALSGLPVVVAGDTNSAPWSYAVRRIAALSESAHIPFKGASWLTRSLPATWTPWLGLPIDNVFARGIAPRSIAAQRSVGSDHLPVLMDFSILEAAHPPVVTVLAN